MTCTNIKGLPEGEYFTECSYSDRQAWKAVKRTAKTVTVVPVLVNPDPEWKPEIIPGGFAGHCTNQAEQTWVYVGVDGFKMRRIYKTKKGWGHKGIRFVEGRATHYYDYNF